MFKYRWRRWRLVRRGGGPPRMEWRRRGKGRRNGRTTPASIRPALLSSECQAGRVRGCLPMASQRALPGRGRAAGRHMAVRGRSRSQPPEQGCGGLSPRQPASGTRPAGRQTSRFNARARAGCLPRRRSAWPALGLRQRGQREAGRSGQRGHGVHGVAPQPAPHNKGEQEAGRRRRAQRHTARCPHVNVKANAR